MIKLIHRGGRQLGHFWREYYRGIIGAIVLILVVWGLIWVIGQAGASDEATKQQNIAACNREEDTVNLIAVNDPKDLPRVLEMFRRDCGAY